MLMGFFFLPPIHLSQQLSFILIPFYLNPQNHARDKKESELLNNQAPCRAGAEDLETLRVMENTAWALLGFQQQESSPRARTQTPWSPSPVGSSDTSSPAASEEPYHCVCVAPTLRAWV